MSDPLATLRHELQQLEDEVRPLLKEAEIKDEEYTQAMAHLRRVGLDPRALCREGNPFEGIETPPYRARLLNLNGAPIDGSFRTRAYAAFRKYLETLFQ